MKVDLLVEYSACIPEGWKERQVALQLNKQ